MRLKLLSAGLQNHTEWEVLKVSELFGSSPSGEGGNGSSGQAMTGPSSHSLTVLGLGLSLLWDTRIKRLSILDLRVARELQRVE